MTVNSKLIQLLAERDVLEIGSDLSLSQARNLARRGLLLIAGSTAIVRPWVKYYLRSQDSASPEVLARSFVERETVVKVSPALEHVVMKLSKEHGLHLDSLNMAVRYALAELADRLVRDDGAPTLEISKLAQQLEICMSEVAKLRSAMESSSLLEKAIPVAKGILIDLEHVLFLFDHVDRLVEDMLSLLNKLYRNSTEEIDELRRLYEQICDYVRRMRQIIRHVSTRLSTLQRLIENFCDRATT